MREWRVRRVLQPHPDGQRHWERAYQQLLAWAQEAGVPAAAGVDPEPPAKEAGHGRDRRRGAAGVELRPDPVHVERLVAEQGAKGHAPDQRRHADGVVPLAGQQHEAHQVAERVGEGDDLGGQAAARAADGLGLGPPLAPLAFW